MNRLVLRRGSAAMGLRAWLACAFVGFGGIVVACSSDNPPNLQDLDGSNKPPIGKGTCATPQEGCPCTNNGAQTACGEVVRRSGDYVTCSEGTRTCTSGKWGTCIGDGVYTKSLQSVTLGGLQTQDLQTQPSPCSDDPCDPACTDFVDNGNGLDAGSGLQPTDSGGISLTQADGSTCQGLQCQQTVCADAGVTTSISGTVVAGTIAPYGSPDPVPNVVVYVPNAALSPFAAGVQCNTSCSAEVSGSPIAATLTNFDGTFTLKNVPVGNNIPVVIQLGRWRREVQFNVTNSCTNTAVGAIHMPRDKADSTPASAANIPFTAVSTGNVDALECVLLKMGVAQSEFTNPGGGGRIEIYNGNGSNAGVSTPNEATLTSSLATLKNYDQILFPCWGSEVIKSAARLSNVLNYTSVGGRVFATHFSYTWLFNNGAFAGTAAWNANAGSWSSRDGRIDTTFAKGQTLASWMQLLGQLNISNSPPDLTIANPRKDMNSVSGASVQWMYNQSTVDHFPLHYTFDTPVGGSNQCGRVVFSDFHVANSASSGTTFPAECPGVPMTAQEKVLEFLLFDLASCGTTIPPLVPPFQNASSFTRDYQGVCPAGKSVVWRFFDWQTVTPSDSNITFQAQTADTQALLPTASPVVGLGTASGAPITSWVGTDVSSALAPNPSRAFLRVTITLNPSSDHNYAPTLTAWRQNYDCVDSQ